MLDALLRTFAVVLAGATVMAHGTAVYPISRVLRVYQANPDNPSFALAAQAVAIDGTLSYYTWNEVSRNISAAVQAGLPAGFDYSAWMPDGQLASAGRVNPSSTEYPRTYAGLDQVSANWPTTPVTTGATIEVDFHATAVHQPSVWDVWMTTPDWSPTTPLNWAQMEFLGRPSPVLTGGHYRFNLTIPANRSGHHVLWVAWQRNDPVGEVFISTSDISVQGGGTGTPYCFGDGTGAACPCGNNGTAGHGCANSVHAAGALLRAVGNPSVTNDSLALLGSHMPNTTSSIYFQGTQQDSVLLGDGLRCVGGSLIRLGVKVNVAGTSGFGHGIRSDIDISLRGAIPPAGGTRTYQVWYRNAAAFCTPSGFNLSNGMEIVWTP